MIPKIKPKSRGMDLNRPMEMTEERLSKLEDKLIKAI